MLPPRLGLRAVCFIALLLFAAPLSAQLVPSDTTEGRTSISYDDEPFANFSAGDGGAGFVKFAIILSQQPLVLGDYFAQTYAPGHHNFTEVFLFEPALDPNVTAQQRAELEAANIRLIHVYHDRALGGDDMVRVLGFDGQFRILP